MESQQQLNFLHKLRKGTTTAAEEDAHAAFVKLDRALKADMSGKEQKKTLDEEDLVTTRDTMTRKMAAFVPS